jgi:glutamate dehydrogenase
VEGLPLPRPLYEIFLHSPRVDGVHLRFGRVARGGIRWSDRPQDFRTEVLGLVKAQQVKNAVIVPVGAKGGFVPKRLPPASDRAAWLAEGTEAYKLFIASLLHITDNLDGDRVVPPVDVVRHDGDDPYLVVAADKGTATFSDTANGISEAHGHWLGDAFASGGSAGYDHKKMGITARGGWEAVKRHFRELDTDIQTTPFTVVGVGDMSGDVFGNGMLLSPAIKLVAAFDHRDIFLDPTPDPAASLKERQRLFALPRSSWADYDASLISAGGGVFSRSAKQIPLSAEAQAALGLAVPSATPQELMTAILKAPVDLLWFGGIGTYVRASSETDADAGDRANDPIRVTGTDVRARVIGEGANLGMTQRARIELAHAGVRLNTDAIDNSAGVNSSDVEVNIKIATATPVRDGRLTLETRNVLLASMTDDVAALVLRNNYLQTLALSLAERKGAADVPGMMRLMRALEADKRLDRAVEYLPADAELVQRAGRGEGLTRPELAVLLAYAKLALHDALVDSEVPDDAYLRSELNRYFPVALRERFPDAIEGHRLRREIVATQLANAIINRGGPGIVVRLQGETGRSAADIARAYALARDVFGILDLNNAIDALDARLPGAVQNGLYAIAERHVSDRMLWFLRHADLTAGLAALVARFRPGVEAVKQTLAQDGDATRAARIAELVVAGVPQALAADLVHGPAAAIALDATLVAERSAAPVPAASATLLALADRLHVHRIKGAVESLALSDDYERLALQRALAGMDDALRRMAGDVLAGDAGAEEALARWLARRGEAVDRASRALAELAAGAATQARVSVAAGLLADLAQGA